MPKKPSFLNGLNDNLQVSLLNSLRNLWCHSSTALEGNSISLGDTQFILDEGLTVSGKTLKEHNEIHGHARAIDLIYDMLGKDAITEEDIFLLHKAIIAENVVDIYKPIGAWKAESNYTNYVTQEGKAAIREYPSVENTPKLMQQWLEKFNTSLEQTKTAEAAAQAYADLHLSLVTIHPFYDGNGRVARLVANLPVLKAGFPPIMIPSEDKKRYRETISAYQETIPSLVTLHDLKQLPSSSAFTELCKGHWTETINLVNDARKLQSKESKPGKGFDFEHMRKNEERAASYKDALLIAEGKAGCGMADNDKTYSGAIMGASKLHVVQNIGREAVIHLKAKLDSVPEKDAVVTIRYENERGVVEPKQVNPPSIER